MEFQLMVEEKGWPEAGVLREKTPPCVVSLSLDLLKECVLMVFLEWTWPRWYLASTHKCMWVHMFCVCVCVYTRMCLYKVVQTWVCSTINTLLHWQTVLNYFVFCFNYLFRDKILPCSSGGSILWLFFFNFSSGWLMPAAHLPCITFKFTEFNFYNVLHWSHCVLEMVAFSDNVLKNGTSSLWHRCEYML